MNSFKLVLLEIILTIDSSSLWAPVIVSHYNCLIEHTLLPLALWDDYFIICVIRLLSL